MRYIGSLWTHRTRRFLPTNADELAVAALRLVSALLFRGLTNADNVRSQTTSDDARRPKKDAIAPMSTRRVSSLHKAIRAFTVQPVHSQVKLRRNAFKW
eukprot:m.557419 g.557419  ORF g.557419 m.557419 type:complete len:99 (+) comp22189_c2_seq48:427-723(+)